MSILLRDNIKRQFAESLDDDYRVETFAAIDASLDFVGMLKFVKSTNKLYIKMPWGWKEFGDGNGEQGAPGTSATIAVGTVTAGDAPAISNSGTASNAVFNFVLPRGPQGIQGPIGVGIQGIPGPRGFRGEAFEIDVRSTFTGRDAFNTMEEGFTVLIEEPGHLYHGYVFFNNGDGTWSEPFRFLGDKGWAPVYAYIDVDAEKTVAKVIDFVGGEGVKPINLSDATPLYVGATGYVSTTTAAVNVKGPRGNTGVGVQGQRGNSIWIAYADDINGLNARVSPVGNFISFVQALNAPPISSFIEWIRLGGSGDDTDNNGVVIEEIQYFTGADLVNGVLTLEYATATMPVIKYGPVTLDPQDPDKAIDDVDYMHQIGSTSVLFPKIALGTETVPDTDRGVVRYFRVLNVAGGSGGLNIDTWTGTMIDFAYAGSNEFNLTPRVTQLPCSVIGVYVAGTNDPDAEYLVTDPWCKYSYNNVTGKVTIHASEILMTGDTIYIIPQYKGTPSACVPSTGGDTGGGGTEPTPTAPSTPPAPTAGTSTATSNSINIAPVSGATSYKLFTSPSSGGSYNLVASELPSGMYNHTGLTSGTTYYYKTRAVNTLGESALSNALVMTTATITNPNGPNEPLAPQDSTDREYIFATTVFPTSYAGGELANYATTADREHMYATEVFPEPNGGGDATLITIANTNEFSTDEEMFPPNVT